jgi:hypothetical protein
MTPTDAKALTTKIDQLKALMGAYATDGRTSTQSHEYQTLYREVALDLEAAKYSNPNPFKSLETFYAHVKGSGMKKYEERRVYIAKLYEDVLLDLARAARNEEPSKQWTKANEVLQDEISPVRAQWLKAKNFTFGSAPDFENSVKESVSSIESTLRILLGKPTGTLGNLLKDGQLDKDVERLVSQAYGYASNRDGVRHGGTQPSTLTQVEAEFFLNFAAAAISYIATKIKKDMQCP